jgi:Phosphotransferase enzyme family
VTGTRPTGPHPALDAWSLFADGDTTFVGDEVVKWTKPSQVYRLRDSSSTRSLIAKRGQRNALDFERSLYEHVLPGLRVRSASYYGFLWEPGTDFAWLFIEDLGDGRFQVANESHRTEAAGYLGALHSSAVAMSDGLPGRRPEDYLACLREGVERLVQALATLPLSLKERAIVGSVIAKCADIESAWPLIEQACVDLPSGLVHGDFVGKNVRLQRLNGNDATIPFDWESAGFGLPAADLAMFGGYELGAAGVRYLDEMRDVCPQLTAEDLRRLADLGVLFRTIHAVAWASLLWPGWVERPLRKLRAYDAELVSALAAATRHA